MTRVMALQKCFVNQAMRVKGEVFNYNGPPAPTVMIPVDDANQPVEKPVLTTQDKQFIAERKARDAEEAEAAVEAAEAEAVAASEKVAGEKTKTKTKK